METLVKLLSTDSRQPQTTRTQAARLATLHRALGTGVPLEQPLRWLSRTAAVEKVLATYSSEATRRSFLTPVLFLTKGTRAHAKYLAIARQLDDEAKEQVLDQARSGRDEANWVTMDDIKAHLKHLTTRVQEVYATVSPGELNFRQRHVVMDHLILSLYTLMPPLRNDFANLPVHPYGSGAAAPPADVNVLHEESPGSYALLLRHYKTVHKYGPKRIPLPPHVSAIVRASLTFFPRPYLLSKIHKPDQPMSRNYLSKHFATIFPGKKLGSSRMRKIVVTEAFAGDTALRKRAELAAAMLHSSSTAARFYEKKH